MGWIGKRGEYGAEALGRWVGISPFAFCADCGQPRKLLRSSSGAKSRGESQVPASSPTTSRPARASGSAATPPTAPSPTMTTSVFLRSVAMATSLHAEGRVRVGGLVERLGPRLHALLFGGHHHADAGIADQFPADEVGVATVIGIAEGALDGVGADKIEEGRGVGGKAGGDILLKVGEHRVLVRRGKLGEGPALGRLRVGVEGNKPRGIGAARAAKGASERAVDVMSCARFGRA